MKDELTRRRFLGTALTLFALPAGALSAQLDDSIVLRFAAMSDVHLDILNRKTAPARIRVTRALDFLEKYCAQQKYNNFDALAVAGDFSNHGDPVELQAFREIADKRLSKETRRVYCMGNHEFWKGNKDLWEEIFETQANTHQTINGFHFIALSPEAGNMKNGDYLYALNWLENELKQASAADPSKPIFLIQHYPPFETVEGSYNRPGEFPAGINDLNPLLAQYPKVIVFCGHSHFPPMDPRSAWQENYTVFGTGSLNFYSFFGGPEKKRAPLSFGKAGTFYLVDVYRDNSIRIKLYDTISESFWDREYFVAEPGNISKYLYTKAREKNAPRPTWTENASLELFDPSPNGAVMLFSQANDKNCMNSYRLTIERFNNENWSLYSTEYYWDEFHVKKRIDKQSRLILGLLPKSRYRFRLWGINAFGKETEKYLETELSTRDDSSTVDRKGPKPRANFIDITFNQNGVNNDPADRDYLRNIKILGAPTLVNDPIMGPVARLDGNRDCFLVPVSSRNYNSIRAEITLGIQFRLENFENDERMNSLFGNTEKGGIGLFINPKTKDLEFWCHLDDDYRVISAHFDPTQTTTAYAVFNGSRMLLYVNGMEAAQQKYCGPIAYTADPNARAFCLGADIMKNAETQFFFKGLIAFARVYTWALSPEQIKNLS